jgi:HNH endonuclease
MKKEKNRYIPAKIQRAVDKRHFFECAFCWVHITERHHINAFAEWGEHSEENLILLCSNCHTQVHAWKIRWIELSRRISTHIKGDRISGWLQFELPKSIVKLWDCTFIDCKNLVVLNSNPIIEISKKSDWLFYLSIRFYDKNGDLIFWMADNRYWCPSDFTLESKKWVFIITRNTEEKILKITQDGDSLIVEGKCWINWKLIKFSTSDWVVIKNGDEVTNIPITTVKNCTFENCLNWFCFDN